MDEKTIEQIKTNLNELKEYAKRFPENSGWRWAVESLDKTLVLLEPKEEPKEDDKFDMPTTTVTQDGSAVGTINIEDTRADQAKAHPVDEAGNIILPPKSEPEITDKIEAELISNAVEEEE